MNVSDPALMMGVAKATRALSRLLVTNGVFALVAVLLLLGFFTPQAAQEPSRNGASAGS